MVVFNAPSAHYDALSAHFEALSVNFEKTMCRKKTARTRGIGFPLREKKC